MKATAPKILAIHWLYKVQAGSLWQNVQGFFLDSVTPLLAMMAVSPARKAAGQETGVSELSVLSILAAPVLGYWHRRPSGTSLVTRL